MQRMVYSRSKRITRIPFQKARDERSEERMLSDAGDQPGPSEAVRPLSRLTTSVNILQTSRFIQVYPRALMAAAWEVMMGYTGSSG